MRLSTQKIEDRAQEFTEDGIDLDYGDDLRTKLQKELLPGFSIKTMEEWGPRLPYGKSRISSFSSRDVRLRKWNTGVMLAIAKELGRKASTDLGGMILSVLKHSVLSIGDTEIDPTDKKVEHHLRSLSFNDGVYAYILVRIAAFRDKFRTRVECARCKNHMVANGSLNDLDVVVVENSHDDDDDPAIGWYELKEPVTLLQAVRTKVKLRPVLLTALGADVFAGGEEQAKIEHAMAAICGVDGVDSDVKLTEYDLAQISAEDISGIYTHIVRISPQPVMIFQYECDKCKFQNIGMIDWKFADFFAASSDSL